VRSIQRIYRTSEGNDEYGGHMSAISEIRARQILDSRGHPTVEADVRLKSGAFGRAAVPSGASTGEHEAVELRDGGDDYLGNGVNRAVSNIVTEMAPELLGIDARNQAWIDSLLREIDGTVNKSRMGGNAILAVSMAVARAAAASQRVPLYRYLGGSAAAILPVPMMNIINGGKHASNMIDLQEFMIVPAGFGTYTRALQAGVEIFQTLRNNAHAIGMPTLVGAEGGLAPDLPTNESVLEFLIEAIVKAGYRPGEDIYLALDPAASEFYRDGRYYMHGCSPGGFSSSELIGYWEELLDDFPIISIEDGLAENDWQGWSEMTRRLGTRIHIVGDDLFVTNTERLRKGINLHAANAILIKLNQIGTVTETLNAIKMANWYAFRAVISHRSGETEDTFISDMAVAMNSGFIKTGAPCRTDRTAKYNQLLRIEEDLGQAGRFVGLEVLPGRR
jgi:enolase